MHAILKKTTNNILTHWFENLYIKILVLWYGLYQFIHIILNSAYLLGLTPWFPPAPVDGWTRQVLVFLSGMALFDLINAILTLIFVIGHLQRKSWSIGLGLITLTVSFYAALIFTYGTMLNGAWTSNNLVGYLWFYIPFIPILLLFFILIIFVGKIVQTANITN